MAKLEAISLLANGAQELTSYHSPILLVIVSHKDRPDLGVGEWTMS